MLASTCTCPACRAVLQAPPVLPARLQCPQCGNKILIPARTTASAVPRDRENESVTPVVPENRSSPSVSPSLRPSASPVPDVLPADSAQPGLPRPVLLGMILGGAALFVALGIGLAIYCFTASSGDGSPARSQNGSSRATSEGGGNSPAGGTGVTPVAPGAPGAEPARRAPPLEPVSTLSPEQQKRVNEAIDRGVTYLKNHVHGGRHVGHHGAIPFIGLTLLECGVPADGPSVTAVTERVRQSAGGLADTYSLSLTILFLDRLGEAKDREIIQTLALRLVAGQNAAGGWTYNCPVLGSAEHKQLLALLETPDASGNITGASGDRPAAPSPPRPAVAAGELLPALRSLPISQFGPGQKIEVRAGMGGDNSNTQFAILALWAARRHGVPAERTLALVDSRFRKSQNADGSWGYSAPGMWPDSMTCAGLLGLAVGRGIDKDRKIGDAAARDEVLEKGMAYLARTVGKPAQNVRDLHANAHGNLYYLWSLERVAVLYDLQKIGGKDWYAWGAEIMVASQEADGSWRDRHAGVPDTCFALLFLKRVNVAKDLTAKLRLFDDLDNLGAGNERAKGEERGPENR